MKKIIAAAALSASMLSTQAHAMVDPYLNWQECTHWGFNADNPKRPNFLMNSTANQPNTCPGMDGTPLAISPCNFAPDVWTRISVTQVNVPANAKMVELNVMFIITPGNVYNTPMVAIEARAPGSTFWSGAWNGYAVAKSEPYHWFGARQNMTLVAPVVNGEVELFWHYGLGDGVTPDLPPPAGAYYGISASLVKYCY